MRVVLLESAIGIAPAEVGKVGNLETRLSNALNQLADDNLDSGRGLYEQGPAVSGTVCLAGIPLESARRSDRARRPGVGVSFAEVAATWSSDPGLAGSGGVILLADGTECLGVDQVTPELNEQMLSSTVGEPFLVDLAGFTTVLLVRPYDELTDARSVSWPSPRPPRHCCPNSSPAPTSTSTRYGYWDAEVAEVLPLGG